MTTRKVEQVINSMATSDGAGVKLRRSIGQARGLYHDPFLMLDEFSSDNPGDYIAGFPAHPHRGVRAPSPRLRKTERSSCRLSLTQKVRR